jgi:uncharacterized damage-inducible protein DinB
MKIIVLAGWAVLAVSSPALAQTSPLAAAAKKSLQTVEGYIVKSAAQTSEADYAFKPTPEVRNFGAILAHIAGGNYLFCSTATGVANPKKGTDIEKTMTSKADLQKVLADSFAFCEAQADALTDAKISEMVDLFGAKQPRLSVLQTGVTHAFEHYGNLVVYMRLKGMVPPSSQRSGM